MKTSCPSNRSRVAFTLVELLIVVAVIAILAALLFPVMGRVNTTRVKKVAAAELNQISTAIEAYKSRYGHYPPDNPASVARNPLYFELVGTVTDGTRYVTLDGYTNVAVSSLPIIGVAGFVNSSTSARGTDDKAAPTKFLKEVKPTQVMPTNGVPILVFSNDSEPWRYNSSNPTNNPGTYDLWVDIVIEGKRLRISNWSKDPQVL